MVRNSRVALDDQDNAYGTWLFDHFRGGTSHFRVQSAAFDVAPPMLVASVPAGGTAGQAIGMAAAATDRLSAVGIHWGFGDSATATGGAVQHAFGSAGAFNVTITATDGVGNTTSTTRPVLVAAVPPPPNKRITSPIKAIKALAKKRRNFRGGQRVELRLTAPGFIGKVARYKLKTGKIPTARNLCLPVGRQEAAQPVLIL